MGGTLTIVFPSKRIRDRMADFLESHFDEAFDLQPPGDSYRRPHFGRTGRRVSLDYAIWLSGFGRLWLEAVAKWTVFTAGTIRTVDGVTGPWLDSDSIGPYPVAMAEGKPHYLHCIEYYMYMTELSMGSNRMEPYLAARAKSPDDPFIFETLFPEEVRPYRQA
jgi:hypothetical protein